MLIGLEAAVVALGIEQIERRQETTGIAAVEVLAYREQVAVARLLTSAHFLEVACNPLLDNPLRYRHVANEFVHAIGSPDEHELWRGIARVWSVIEALTNRLREATFHRDQPDETEFKLLRHSSLLLPKKIQRSHGAAVVTT
jgi:hypothetical protein